MHSSEVRVLLDFCFGVCVFLIFKSSFWGKYSVDLLIWPGLFLELDLEKEDDNSFFFFFSFLVCLSLSVRPRR